MPTTTPSASPAPPPLAKPPAAALPPPAPPRNSPSVLGMIDEAALRLRLAPIGTLGIYYAGSLPFILALLYFWTDMRRNPDAARDATGASLGMAALFIGMKVAQAVFAARLRAQFARHPPIRWTWTRLGRLALVQAVWQTSGLFLLPLAAVVTLPLAWVYAFYANVTALGDGETASARAVFVRAARAALRDAKGNHLALLVLSLFGIMAWMNLVAATLLLPQLAQTLTGEDNVFTRSGLHVFNSTFFAVTFALVYLALDPLVKTFYALRCFHDDSRQTGEDLQSALRALPALVTGGALALALGLMLASSAVAAAPTAATPAPAASQAVSASALGRSVEDVLRQREFTWRAPRPSAPTEADQPGPVARFFKEMQDWVGHLFARLRDWLRQLWRDQRDPSDAARSGGLDPAMVRLLFYAVITLFVAVLVALGWNYWRARRGDALTGQAVPGVPVGVPDLADESLLASQLPEDEWLRLAGELLARGERRLALRAYYLSTLAALEARGLLAVARHKSNRDYLGELRRRARDRGGLAEAFTRNVGRFERVWYGPHPADDVTLREFEADRARVLEPG